jgi:small subunit ribosomal protein S4e
MYKTRNQMLNEWPIERKGTKYLAAASHSSSKGIPILFIIRNMLKLARTRKEVEYMLRNKDVKINNKTIKEDNFPVLFFDTITLEKSGKNYRMIIDNKKFKLQEISGKEAEKKVSKIINKKSINKSTIQMNLEDGRNFLTKDKFSVGDSAIINTKEGKIEKILPLKDGAKVKIVSGKYSGHEGKIKTTKELARGREYIIQLKEKEVQLPLKTMMVVE